MDYDIWIKGKRKERKGLTEKKYRHLYIDKEKTDDRDQGN